MPGIPQDPVLLKVWAWTHLEELEVWAWTRWEGGSRAFRLLDAL